MQHILTKKLIKFPVQMRSMALFPWKTLKDDKSTATPITTILDRTAEVFFMTEIFRGLWLTFEVAMKPKVTINYPFEKGPLSPRFRGEHGIYYIHILYYIVYY
jgi:hypothetical protein